MNMHTCTSFSKPLMRETLLNIQNNREVTALVVRVWGAHMCDSYYSLRMQVLSRPNKYMYTLYLAVDESNFVRHSKQ